jgi:hypothetical protein
VSTNKEMTMKVMKLGKEGKKNEKAIEAEIQVGINLVMVILIQVNYRITIQKKRFESFEIYKYL